MNSETQVFETMRTYRGRVRALELHLTRLSHSVHVLNTLRGDPPISPHQWDLTLNTLRRQLKSLLKDHAPLDPLKSDFQRAAQLNFNTERVIRCWVNRDRELTWAHTPLDLSYVGLSRSVAWVVRPDEPAYPPEIKHNDRDSWERQALALKADEILWCDRRGVALESHNSNLWALICPQERVESLLRALERRDPQPLIGTRWITPPLTGQCLSGITRALMISFLRRAGAEVNDRDPELTQGRLNAHLPTEYYYLSSTLKSLSPISEMDATLTRRPPFDAQLCAWCDEQLSLC